MLPLVKLSGSPYDQGLKHGQTLINEIKHNLALYFERFKTEVFLEPAEVLSRAERYAKAIEQDSPDYFAAMKGVAEGSGTSFGEIVALNVRYEILYYEFGVGEHERAGIDGCTSFALLPERTQEKHLLMGQSWDWIPEVKGAILKTVQPTNSVSLAFTEAGIVGGKIGLNSHGIGLCINGLASFRDDWTNLGKPFHVRCYEVLSSSTFEDAKNAVLQKPRPGSGNFMVAQAPDQLLNIELAPKSASQEDAANGKVSHTNHFLEPAKLDLEQLEDEFWQRSCKRKERIDELLGAQETFSVDDLKTVLRDHKHHPNSVCRHEDFSDGPEEHYISVVSVVLDINVGKMWVSDGPPCENPFELYSLSL